MMQAMQRVVACAALAATVGSTCFGASPYIEHELVAAEGEVFDDPIYGSVTILKLNDPNSFVRPFIYAPVIGDGRVTNGESGTICFYAEVELEDSSVERAWLRWDPATLTTRILAITGQELPSGPSPLTTSGLYIHDFFTMSEPHIDKYGRVALAVELPSEADGDRESALLTDIWSGSTARSSLQTGGIESSVMPSSSGLIYPGFSEPNELGSGLVGRMQMAMTRNGDLVFLERGPYYDDGSPGAERLFLRTSSGTTSIYGDETTFPTVDVSAIMGLLLTDDLQAFAAFYGKYPAETFSRTILGYIPGPGSTGTIHTGDSWTLAKYFGLSETGKCVWQTLSDDGQTFYYQDASGATQTLASNGSSTPSSSGSTFVLSHTAEAVGNFAYNDSSILFESQTEPNGYSAQHIGIFFNSCGTTETVLESGELRPSTTPWAPFPVCQQAGGVLNTNNEALILTSQHSFNNPDVLSSPTFYRSEMWHWSKDHGLTLIAGPDAPSVTIRTNLVPASGVSLPTALSASSFELALTDPLSMSGFCATGDGHVRYFNDQSEGVFETSLHDTSTGQDVADAIIRVRIYNCIADWNNDRVLSATDDITNGFLVDFANADPHADINHDGLINTDDLVGPDGFLTIFSKGCPTGCP